MCFQSNWKIAVYAEEVCIIHETKNCLFPVLRYILFKKTKFEFAPANY